MSEDNLEIVRRSWDAWIHGDLAGMYAFWATDAVWDLSNFADAPEEVFQGVEAIDRFFQDWLGIWDDYEVGVDDFLVAPDGRIVVLYWHRGRGHRSGLEMELHNAQISTVSDGKITRMEIWDDPSEALAAVGLN